MCGRPRRWSLVYLCPYSKSPPLLWSNLGSLSLSLLRSRGMAAITGFQNAWLGESWYLLTKQSALSHVLHKLFHVTLHVFLSYLFFFNCYCRLSFNAFHNLGEAQTIWRLLHTIHVIYSSWTSPHSSHVVSPHHSRIISPHLSQNVHLHRSQVVSTHLSRNEPLHRSQVVLPQVWNFSKSVRIFPALTLSWDGANQTYSDTKTRAFSRCVICHSLDIMQSSQYFSSY